MADSASLMSCKAAWDSIGFGPMRSVHQKAAKVKGLEALVESLIRENRALRDQLACARQENIDGA